MLVIIPLFTLIFNEVTCESGENQLAAWNYASGGRYIGITHADSVCEIWSKAYIGEMGTC